MIRVVIELDEQTGAFRVSGMPMNAVMAYGMLELARDFVHQSTMKIDQPRPSDVASLLRELNPHSR